MFRAAGPQLTAGARFALYAERLVPLYAQMQEIQDSPMPKGDLAGYAAAAGSKLAAGTAIPLLKSVLFPEDDDGLA